jgi:Ca2+-binding RTX toxin-like protein
MPHPVRPAVLIVIAVGSLAFAGPATAGELSMAGGEDEDGNISSRGVDYYASARADSVSISRRRDELVVKDERGIKASGPCKRETRTRGTCPLGAVGGQPSAEYVYVFLGEGNDSVEFDGSVKGLDAIVEGYGGNDVIRGTPQGDLLYGGSGKDRIAARGGGDVIRGDGWYGEENEEPNHRNLRDVIKGGGGIDAVRYADEGHGATRIHLGGGRGEDKVTGVEQAAGTGGADKITGNSAGNVLEGEGGRDRIRGEGGNDLILAGERAREIACGAGRDEIKVDAEVRPRRDCEHAYAGYLVPVRVATAYEVADGQISFVVACPSEEEQIEDDNYGDDPCKSKLRLKRAGGGIAGATKFNFQMSESGTVSIPLSAADRKALANGETFWVETTGGGYYNHGFAIPLAS